MRRWILALGIGLYWPRALCGGFVRSPSPLPLPLKPNRAHEAGHRHSTGVARHADNRYRFGQLLPVTIWSHEYATAYLRGSRHCLRGSIRLCHDR